MGANEIDEARLEALSGKVMGDVGGAMSVLMAYIGDQAGVFDAMDAAGPSTAAALSARTGVDERYLLEWLSAITAAGYARYDAEDETFSLTPEQALVFAREGQPACMQGFFQAVVSQYDGHEKAVDTFAKGTPRPWSEQSACCFRGTDRFFRPGYAAQLVGSWIPALDGVEAKLRSGAKVADIGCGFGSSSVLMAEAYPNSRFHGFDFHPPSIEAAREKARGAGVSNLSFEVAAAKDFPGTDYDFVCIFDALHDMGDPVGAAAHVKSALKPDGTFMVVEPMAGDALAENLHLLGQIFYAFSTVACTPASKAQEVGLALGAQAGERRLAAVLKQAGFGSVRRATETPTNMVLEARG